MSMFFNCWKCWRISAWNAYLPFGLLVLCNADCTILCPFMLTSGLHWLTGIGQPSYHIFEIKGRLFFQWTAWNTLVQRRCQEASCFCFTILEFVARAALYCPVCHWKAAFVGPAMLRPSRLSLQLWVQESTWNITSATRLCIYLCWWNVHTVCKRAVWGLDFQMALGLRFAFGQLGLHPMVIHKRSRSFAKNCSMQGWVAHIFY